MEKFKKYNEILCEEFCEEMKKFEKTRHPEHLKAVKELAEVWADLQCIEAGEAMRKIAKREYGYGDDMGEWNEEAIYAVYDASRGGRGGRRRSRETGRFISNRGGRSGSYNMGNDIYNASDENEEREKMYNNMYPPMYMEYDMYNRQGQGGNRRSRNGRSGQSYNRGGQGSSSNEQGSQGNQNGSYNAYEPYDPNQMYMLRQQDGMPIWTPYAKHEKGEAPKKLTKEQVKKWIDEMENEDGTTGAHWNEQQAEQLAQKIGAKFEDFSKETFWACLCMVYSDYCATLEHYGMNKPEIYACLAKDFLEDEDYPGKDGNEKLAAYYFYVLQKD